MLWTDDVFITAADLATLDSEIPTIATDENVVLEGDTGFIRRQIDESGENILQRMEVFGGWVGSNTMSANHIQAVLNVSGGASSSRTRVLLNQVVVSDRVPDKWSHIKRWVCYRTVCAFYRNVYSRVASKDRYKTKLTEFNRELQRTQNFTFEDLGLPVCYQPLARPAAKFDIEPGSWGVDNLSTPAGAGTVDSLAYDVVITYTCDQFYLSSTTIQLRRNGESHPSDRAVITLTTGTVLHVDITSLNPPDGNQDPGTMPLNMYTPLRATHWNIYAGKKDGALYLQTSTPIPIATKTHSLAGDPLLGGPGPGLGQYADRRYQFQKMLQRA